MRKSFLFAAMLTAIAGYSQAYNGSYNFRGDPATNYNKHMVGHSERTYVQIGPHKVLGTYFLFGSNHLGNIYSPEQKAENIHLSYNTYNQQLEFTSTSNPDKPLVKEPGELDSFVLRSDSLIENDMFFVYGSVLGSTDKAYFQRITDPSKKEVLYKRYKSAIGVPTNYVEADMRQFEMEISYYVYNRETKDFHRLKHNYQAIKKEYGSVPNFASLVTKPEVESNPEKALRKLFNSL